MAKSFLTDLNLNTNVLLNAKIQAWGTDPTLVGNATKTPDNNSAGPKEGMLSSYAGALYIYKGTSGSGGAWVQVGNALSDSTSTTSSTTGASSTAVKAAYDLANNALPKSGGTMTGKLTLVTVSGSGGSINFPSGAVPSSPSTGDMWGTGTALSYYTGSATKTIAFTDSAMTGTVNGTTIPSSATLLTSTSTSSALTTVGTLNGLAVASSQTITMGSNRITNVADPTSAQDAATKNYVDNVAQGINVHDAVVGIVTTQITGTYAIGSTTNNPPGDGGTGVGATITYTATGVMTSSDSTSPVTFAAGDRVLITGGVSSGPATWTPAIANGIYVVTTAGASGVAAVLTRATDADNSIFGDLAAGDLVYVISGGTYGGTQWVQTTKGTATTGSGAATKYSVKVSTDSVAYTQFSGAGAVPYASTTVAGIASFPSAQFSVGATGAVTIGNLAGSLITSGTVSPTYGGTGVNNGSSTLTLAGNVTHAGPFTRTFTATGNTSLTLPTTGTLATLTGSEALTNKTINGLTVTSSTGTLTVANSKTVTVNNTLTLAGTDSTTMTFPSASGTVARKATQVGTGTGSTISWTNAWGTNLVVAQVYDTSTTTATLVEVDITATTSAVVATFASASTNLANYTLVITG